MNREIKFRAWTSSYGGTMRTPNELIVVNGIIIGANLGLIGATDIILMQYTGLKDKNGTEIYEGDILEEETSIFVVEWNTKEAKFDRKTIGGISPLHDIKRYEIIGNVYESPELLTK